MFLEVGTRLKSKLHPWKNPGDPVNAAFPKGIYARVVGYHFFPENDEGHYMVQPEDDVDHFDMTITEVAHRFSIDALP